MKSNILKSAKGLAAGLSLSALLLSTHIGFGQVVPITSITSTGTLGSSGAASSGLSNLKDGIFTSTSFQEWIGAGSITLDMGAVKTVDRLVVVTSTATGSSAPLQGSVEVSLDGVTWTKVKDYINTGAVGGSVLALGFGAQQARFVRFVMDSPSVNTQIAEIQLFNGTGPRVSLLSYGSTWQPANETSGRVPYNLVDRNASTFGVFNATSPGELILHLDSVEYDHGWNSISLGIRSNAAPGGPNNPGKITVYAGNALGEWTEIYTGTYDAAYNSLDYLLDMGGTRTEDYIKIAFDKTAGWNPTNFQFFGIDVMPVPEPGLAGSAFVAVTALLLWRRRY